MIPVRIVLVFQATMMTIVLTIVLRTTTITAFLAMKTKERQEKIDYLLQKVINDLKKAYTTLELNQTMKHIYALILSKGFVPFCEPSRGNKSRLQAMWDEVKEKEDFCWTIYFSEDDNKALIWLKSTLNSVVN